MTSSPLFSVLVANFNNGRFLQQAIDSVYAQTYSNWEIILVDDGSTDNSHKLYEHLNKDNRIHIYYNDRNRGCGYTKRRCAELANGEICGFLDPDDVLLPNALDSHVKAQLNNPNASLVVSRFYYCDEELNIRLESRLLIIEKDKSYLTTQDYAPEVFASYKKQNYDLTEGLSCYSMGVDQDLYLKLEEVGDIFILDEFTYKYRVGEQCISKAKEIALAWNIIVRNDACNRRGMKYDDLGKSSIQIFCENEKKDSTYETELRIRSSKAYRLGKTLLQPFYWVKSSLKR